MAKNEIVLFTDGNTEIEVQISPEQETVWLTQKQMGELFGVKQATLSEHIKNIIDTGELDETSIGFSDKSSGGRKPKIYNKRPVLMNNWEGTYFDFDDDKIMDIADSAKEAGCEMLVLDDGWFGARYDDHAGLGDWVVNRDKLKKGMDAIADHVESLGMKFGLWFEPEMVNEDSDLYRAHPDWALTDPGRKPVMARDQLVLDMSRPEVIEYLYESISTVLRRAKISYIKWDFNRSLSNVFSRGLSADRQGEVAHRFVLGSYRLMERLRESFPDVMIEGCSGGGGRFDAGILFYSPQIWCSDNTEAINRLKIQKGTTYGYPVSTIGSHASASPNHQTGREVPLMTRAIVAMAGTFGYAFDPVFGSYLAIQLHFRKKW